MKRRTFLKRSVQVAVAGSLVNGLTGCVEQVDGLNYNGALPFIHGVASGDPLHDRVILWTRITQDQSLNAKKIPVGYVVATDIDFKNVVASGTTFALAAKDYTVKVDVVLPKSNTTYYYGFQALNHYSPIGRTRTAPRADEDISNARIAVCSCTNFGFGYFNGYANIAKQSDLSAVLHLGDYIYEHQEGFYSDPFLLSQRPLDPKHEIVTLSDYRRRYACYRKDEDLQECHRQHPFITVWDDHEIANDSWMHGAQNHQSSEGKYETRKLAAVQAYREWMPIRDNKETTMDSNLRIYRNFTFGKLINLTMLDTRLFGREKPDFSNHKEPKRQLLGAEQEQWLFNELDKSKQRGTQWNLLGQQVILAPFKGSSASTSSDLWNGYKSARTRLLNHIENSKLDNTVVLTGDYHASFAFDVCQNPFDSNSYNKDTGEGSIAVEYVCPAMTSGTFPEIAGPLLNPHQKFNDQVNHGFMLLDVDKERCQCEWYFLNTLQQRNDSAYMVKALATKNKQNHLVEGFVSSPLPNAPALAPNNYAKGGKIQKV